MTLIQKPLTQFLEEKLKDLISKKYGIPKEEITEEVLEEKLEQLKETHDGMLKWRKDSVMGGALDGDLEFLTGDEIKMLDKRVNAFLSRFKHIKST
jgi:hypothetical protein